MGYTNAGKPNLGGPCGRCKRSGFVPLIDGEPSFPFGKDRNHPQILAHEAANPTTKTASRDAEREQGVLM
jgi:hypothetical protein